MRVKKQTFIITAIQTVTMSICGFIGTNYYIQDAALKIRTLLVN